MHDLYPYHMNLTLARNLIDLHGTMVLSCFPFTGSTRPFLGSFPGHLTAARILLEGQSLWVASTHLVKPNTEDGQILQWQQLTYLSQWVQSIKEPLVMGGDFNSMLYTPQME